MLVAGVKSRPRRAHRRVRPVPLRTKAERCGGALRRVVAGPDGLDESCRALALGDAAAITLAYYPDGRQERLFAARGVAAHVDLMHMMTYDQGGAHHSPMALADRVS